jgi:hypothetical protein
MDHSGTRLVAWIYSAAAFRCPCTSMRPRRFSTVSGGFRTALWITKRTIHGPLRPTTNARRIFVNWILGVPVLLYDTRHVGLEYCNTEKARAPTHRTNPRCQSSARAGSGNRTLMNGAAGCPAILPVLTRSGFCSRRAYSPPTRSASGIGAKRGRRIRCGNHGRRAQGSYARKFGTVLIRTLLPAN